MLDQASSLREVARNRGMLFNPAGKNKTVQSKIAKSIAVTSGKGGVGKSSIALNLGLALADLGRKSLLLDADLNLANIDILFGIAPKKTLNSLLDENVRLEDIIIKEKRTGFSILPGSSGALDLLGENPEIRNAIINSLVRCESRYSYMLIDTAAGIDKVVMDFLLASENLLVVATPDPTSITDAYALIKVSLNQKSFRRVYILVNQAESKKQAVEVFEKLRLAVKKFLKFKVYPAGYVLRDKKMIQAIRLQKPVIRAFPDSPASLCIKALAKKLIGEIEGSWEFNATGQSYFDKLKSYIIYKENISRLGAI